MKKLILALFMTCFSSSCGGTHGGNPSISTVNLAVSLGGNSNAGISKLSLCLSAVRFVPTLGGAAANVSIDRTGVAVTSGTTGLTQATVPVGNYRAIQTDLTPGCGGLGSVGWTNGSGTFSSTDVITLQFATSFELTSSTQGVQLGIQPFADELASLYAAASAKAALESVAGTVAITNGGSGGVNLEVPIELVDLGLASSTSSTAFSRTRTTLNTADYDGTVTYTLEVVANNTDSVPRDVTLVDSTGTVVASIGVSPGSPGYAPVRYSTTFLPTAGASDYRIQLAGTPSIGLLQLTEARIRVRQVGATQTKIYIPLMAGFYNQEAGDAGQSTDATSSATYSEPEPAWYSLWKKDDSKFSQLAAGQPWTFEAVLSVDSGVGTAYASLFDSVSNQQIAGSEVSTGTAGPTLLSASFADSATGFTNLDTIQVRIKQAGGYARIYRGGIWVKLASLSHAEVYLRDNLSGDQVSGDNATTLPYFRALIDTSTFSSASIYQEVVGGSDPGTSCTSSVFDYGPSDFSSNGQTVSKSSITITSLSSTLQRSTALSLGTGDRFSSYLSATTGPGACGIVTSFLVFSF